MSDKPGGAIQGTFPSLKMKCPVRYTSTLERDLLFVLEYEQQVIRYQEQPFQIQTTLEDGHPHRYTPDYALWTDHEQILVECKPANKLDDLHTQQQIRIGEYWSQTNGWQFVLITDTMLRQGERLTNLKLLWRYSRLPVDTETWRSYLARCVGETSVLNLAQEPKAVPVVLHMVFHHFLQADLSRPLTMHSLVWR